MGLVTKARNKKLKKEALSEESPRGKELSGALYSQFQQFHSSPHQLDMDTELLIIKQRQFELENQGWFKHSKGLPMFSPSSMSKCERELFFKAQKSQKDGQQMLPYQQRWVRNSTAVHEATQRDILYMGKLMKNPAFTVKFNEEGLPMWEKNNAQKKDLSYDGEMFSIAGMMDGLLDYKDGSTVGFEFKTKTNSVAQVGHYKMKDITGSHKQQCIGYSLLFGVNEFIVMYEAVAKDQWMKGSEARKDIRTFYYKVTEKEQMELLQKLARVTKAVRLGEIPEKETDKCLFCPYKSICELGE